MFGYHVPRLRTLAMIALLLVLSAAAYGFAAANTVPNSGAGDGSGTITGYVITDVRYTLNATNPANIDSVSFTVTPGGTAAAPTSVKAKLVSTSSTYSSCTNTAGTTWSCAVTGVTALAADELRVIAAQ
jgi:hypothetical protein